MKLTKRQKTTIGIMASLLVVVSAIVGIATSSGWWTATGENSESVADSEEKTVTGDPLELPAIRLLESDSYSRTVIHTGTVETRNHTMVAFQRGGQIQELLADEGQHVSPTQPLAILDNRHLTGQRDALAARLKQSMAILAELNNGSRPETIKSAQNVVNDLTEQLYAQKLRLDRSADLLASHSIARQDYEQELFSKRALDARLMSAQSKLDELIAGSRAETIEAQEAQVASIEAELQIVLYGLDDCHLVAPFSGMIVSRYVDSGSVVEAGTPIFELIDDQNLEVHVGVPQKVADQLRRGATYKVLAGTTEIDGTLRVVLPRVESSTRTCKAIFDVKLDPEWRVSLYTGQLARVKLVQEIAETGFWIPISALTADHSGLWSCYVVEGHSAKVPEGLARKQSVEILHQRDQFVYVRGTLENGQVLISDGMHRVVSGQKVRVRLEDPGHDSSVLSATRTSIGR